MSLAEIPEQRAATSRPVVCWIDLDTFQANVELLRRIVDPAQVMVVVKANAYGHGVLPIAERAVEAGASGVAVSVVDEAAELRAQGFSGEILVLTEPDREGFGRAAVLDVACTVMTEVGIQRAAASVAAAHRPLRLHLKIDTGMHRLGAEPEEALGLATVIARSPYLLFDGLFTHLAVADEPTNPMTDVQLDRFDQVRRELSSAGIHPRIVHAANSAGAIAHPRARYDLVRVGIAAYGHLPAPSPFGENELREQGAALRPVLSLVSSVQTLRHLRQGERTSYGLRYELQHDSIVATVPIGYADGLPRLLGERGGEVLIGGRRRRIAGTVTMDQIIVDLGCDDSVALGDEVVLIGAQGAEEIAAWEWAERTGTIAYEILTRLGPRIPRRLR